MYGREEKPNTNGAKEREKGEENKGDDDGDGNDEDNGDNKKAKSNGGAPIIPSSSPSPPWTYPIRPAGCGLSPLQPSPG